MNTRAVLITGGTGFIGGHLIGALLESGISVWVSSRNAPRARRRLDSRVHVVGTLGEIPTDAHIAGIVDLAGAPVVGPPWTENRRRVLVDSRIGSTREVLRFVESRQVKPELLVSASAIGYYGSRGDEWLDESSAPTQEFQSQLCRQREAVSNEALALGLRVLDLRLGLVLGRDGGIFPRLALAARCGAAAVLGDGRQWMSWVHIDDVVRAVELALGDESLQGALNLVSPAPVRQREFQLQLTRSLQRPLWLRVPQGVLRMAMGEMSDLLVRGQRVAPALLRSRGFEFSFPELDAALTDLLRP